eukprot:NODE_91_length_3344_cov_27.406373_g82_i0.p1 GENE.NODE_91_length_3344_cov_27.406373_g82_i0~~NODE_91_length_3344_cov_27.406373_g82_i0.p1  ORF type:complete len:1031 (-),score=207.77 NODE_91_length_3344_cov_27.406373_g82_i0:251-3271(-)
MCDHREIKKLLRTVMKEFSSEKVSIEPDECNLYNWGLVFSYDGLRIELRISFPKPISLQAPLVHVLRPVIDVDNVFNGVVCFQSMGKWQTNQVERQVLWLLQGLYEHLAPQNHRTPAVADKKYSAEDHSNGLLFIQRQHQDWKVQPLGAKNKPVKTDEHSTKIAHVKSFCVEAESQIGKDNVFVALTCLQRALDIRPGDRSVLFQRAMTAVTVNAWRRTYEDAQAIMTSSTAGYDEGRGGEERKREASELITSAWENLSRMPATVHVVPPMGSLPFRWREQGGAIAIVPTISHALHSAQDGWTVILAPGSYTIEGPIDIVRNVRILGCKNDPSKCVISGEKTLLRSVARNVQLCGVTLKSTGAVESVLHVTSGTFEMKNCILESQDATYPILGEYSGTTLRLSHSTVFGGRDVGLVIRHGASCSGFNLSMRCPKRAAAVEDKSVAHFSHCTFDGDNGIFVLTSAMRLEHSTVSSGFGVAVATDAWCWIEDTAIKGSNRKGAAVFVEIRSLCTLKNCKVTQHYWGVEVASGATANVLDCVFDSVARGIDLRDQGTRAHVRGLTVTHAETALLAREGSGPLYCQFVRIQDFKKNGLEAVQAHVVADNVFIDGGEYGTFAVDSRFVLSNVTVTGFSLEGCRFEGPKCRFEVTKVHCYSGRRGLSVGAKAAGKFETAVVENVVEGAMFRGCKVKLSRVNVLGFKLHGVLARDPGTHVELDHVRLLALPPDGDKKEGRRPNSLALLVESEASVQMVGGAVDNSERGIVVNEKAKLVAIDLALTGNIRALIVATKSKAELRGGKMRDGDVAVVVEDALVCAVNVDWKAKHRAIEALKASRVAVCNSTLSGDIVMVCTHMLLRECRVPLDCKLAPVSGTHCVVIDSPCLPRERFYRDASSGLFVLQSPTSDEWKETGGWDFEPFSGPEQLSVKLGGFPTTAERDLILPDVEGFKEMNFKRIERLGDDAAADVCLWAESDEVEHTEVADGADAQEGELGILGVGDAAAVDIPIQ